MTYSMIVGKYKLIFSDTHFKDFRKKPTISVYDADTNSETKIASFNSQETFEWFIEAVVKADRKTENNSEKPNNCEHITEDGVTCAKYPACDDCLDNPLNKVKGSERLVKGSKQTDLVEDSPSLVKDLVKAFGEDGTWLERQGVYTLTLAEAKQRAVDIIESVLAKDEPTISKMEQVEEPMKTTDYCDICKRDMCEICVADATNPYCVPSHYEIRYEPKTEPQTDCHWK